MSTELIGVVGIGILIVLVVLRVPVAAALMIVGLCGYWAVDGSTTAFYTLGEVPFSLAQAYSLSVVPLFLLLGVVASRTRMASELYAAASLLFSKQRGGIAMSTIGACAGFGAVCGSSLATASTMARVSIPEMRKYGYSDSLSAGVVASAGTLGILVPPSIIMIIYAIAAQVSVPLLFAAALLPALVLTLLNIATLWVLARTRPDEVPAHTAPAAGWRVVTPLWKLVLLFGVVVGGIFAGVFSPTEAAAVGAFMSIMIGLATRQLSIGGLADCFTETVQITGSLFLVVLGAYMFAAFMVQTRIPLTLSEWIASGGLGPYAVIALIALVYLVLGCFLDSISMILVTVPVFLPLIESVGFSPVWFGIFLVIVAEIGLITPPIGLNIFVIKGQMPDIAVMSIYRGILPFLVAQLIGLALLVAVPGIALWLPSLWF